MIEHLNETQKQLVLETEGPIMALAGPGSGKTRSLVHRIENLIKNKKIESYKILAITFTNKAAKEMKSRVEDSLGEYYPLNIYTFHSFCVRLLRKELNSNFNIYDDSDSKAVLKKILKDQELDPKEYPVNSIYSYICELKNEGYYIGKKELSKKENSLKKDFDYDFYLTYEEELKKSNAVDFNDLIVKTLQLLTENTKIQEYWETKFQYIMVDEYQDTNRAQYELLKILRIKNKNLFIIGDEDQSIYSWRGADIQNILDFEKDFPDYKLIKLEENYRSTKNILNAANNIIENNIYRKGKILKTQNDQGTKIFLNTFYNEKQEAQEIVSLLKQIKNLEDISQSVIMFRNNSQSRIFEEELRKNNLAYNLIGGMKFYERKEIKDIIAYFKVIYNHNDEVNLRRIINYPSRGLGQKTLEKIALYDRSNNFWGNLVKVGQEKELKVSKKANENIQKFINLINEAKKTTKLLDIFDLVYEESGYRLMLEDSKSHEDIARKDNLREFRNSLYDYDKQGRTLSDLLEDVSLVLDVDEDDDSQERVNLMTIHASKGLEFKRVFIIGLEENIFPSSKTLNESIDPRYGLEEERRLMYVAITRAEEFVYLSHAKQRFQFGSVHFNELSRFVSEIEDELMQKKDYSIDYRSHKFF